MRKLYQNIRNTKTMKLFDKLNLFWYLSSLSEFWIIDLELSNTLQKGYIFYKTLIRLIMVVYTAIVGGAFFTDHKFNSEQQHRAVVVLLGTCTALFYQLILCYYKSDIRQILHHLTVSLKKYNNTEIESKMLSKIKWYAGTFISCCIISAFHQGVKGLMQVDRGELFVTFATIWPDIDDPSLTAEIARYIIYLTMFIIAIQMSGVLLVVITILIIISYQFENLTMYFYELNEIFKDMTQSQEEREREYETELVKGLRWHILTIWCIRRFEYVCRIIFNLHLTLAPIILLFILPEMTNPDMNTRAKAEQLPNFIGLLLYLGIVMWNAGSITVEASKLPEGLFGSGWENCHGRNCIKVRKMIFIAIQQAQQPIVFKAFGIMELSHESYVRIVKTTYSVFSVLSL